MSYTAIVARTDNASLFESLQFESSHDRSQAFDEACDLLEEQYGFDGFYKIVAIIPGYHTAWAK